MARRAALSLPDFDQPFTKLGAVYSHPWGVQDSIDHKILAGSRPLKSGLTPSNYPGSTLFTKKANQRGSVKSAAQKQHEGIQRYQQDRFRGFTTEELIYLESFAPLDEDSNFEDQLPNSIHPAFRKARWLGGLLKHQARFPIGNGKVGFWEAETDEVWAALKPALKIASHILGNSHTWVWWDALINGKYERIPPAELPGGSKDDIHNRFSPPDPWHQTASQDVQNNEIKAKLRAFDLQHEIRLYSAEVSPDTGLQRDTLVAETEHFQVTPSIIWLAYETVVPLLNEKITASEKMLCHFRIASTLLHEFTHLLWGGILCYDKNAQLETLNEPYYTNEIFGGELGYSMELAVFGAMTSGYEFTRPTYASTKGLPLAGFFQGPFHTGLKNYIPEKYPTLEGEKPEGWDHPTYYPVPLEYFNKLSRPEFWSNVRGKPQSLLLGPKSWGTKFTGPRARQRRTDLPFLGEEFTHDVNMVDRGQTPGEQRKAEEQNGIEKRVSKINRAREGNTTRKMVPPPKRAVIDEDLDPDAMDIDVEPMPTFPSPFPGPPGEPVHRDFNEVRDYIQANYWNLAIDTMNFTMSEQVFQDHILRRANADNFALNFAILRNFFLQCSTRKPAEYFRIKELSHGPLPTTATISKILKGWRPPPKPDVPIVFASSPYIPPSQDVITWFDMCTSCIVDEQDIDRFNIMLQYDYDIYHFMDLANIVAGEGANWAMGVLPQFYDPNFFTIQTFTSCVYENQLNGNTWTLGPEGIIRKLSTETDAIPELKPADRKRKADSDRQGHASEPGRERTKRRYTKRGTGGRKKLV